ncbi:MAG TPA: SpoIIE family protein phosphatase [Actinomycetota bacterium]|nr:SpoIIE family protein phosphatase [Actinomycetota bacterium]
MKLDTAVESERLAAVRRYDVLDTPPDGSFDRITELAARLMDVPIAIVSIVDSDRIWFKSHHGLDVEQIGREPGLCASAILQDRPWLVNDASVDPRTLSNPLVAGDFGLRFYLGVPLKTHDGYNLGTLCVIDREPREVSEQELANLEDLAAIVMDELELRLSARLSVALESELRRTAEDVAVTLQESLLPPTLPSVEGLEFASRYHVAARDRVGGDFYDVIKFDSGCAVVVGDVCGKGAKAAALTGAARWTLRTTSLEARPPSEVLQRLNHIVAGATEGTDRYLTIAYAHLVPNDSGAEVTLSLGGHPHPIVVPARGPVARVGATAPIVGWRAEETFHDVALDLAPGDLLVMFTDGLQEAIGGHGTADDLALQELLARLAGQSAESVAQAIDEAFGSDAMHDDAAFVVVRVSDRALQAP